ncbi:hypothetical protein GQX74_014897 [Glossina fuscipes]|nr:hypothetical protein GQX74_014897 [Glossina fuscipes]
MNLNVQFVLKKVYNTTILIKTPSSMHAFVDSWIRMLDLVFIYTYICILTRGYPVVLPEEKHHPSIQALIQIPGKIVSTVISVVIMAAVQFGICALDELDAISSSGIYPSQIFSKRNDIPKDTSLRNHLNNSGSPSPDGYPQLLVLYMLKKSKRVEAVNR